MGYNQTKLWNICERTRNLDKVQSLIINLRKERYALKKEISRVVHNK